MPGTLKRRFVICVRNDDHPESLDIRRVYRLLQDAAAEKDGFLRVIDETGEDYLYPRDWFVPVDVPKPAAEILESTGGAGG